MTRFLFYWLVALAVAFGVAMVAKVYFDLSFWEVFIGILVIALMRCLRCRKKSNETHAS